MLYISDIYNNAYCIDELSVKSVHRVNKNPTNGKTNEHSQACVFYTVHDHIQGISSRDPACSIYLIMCHKPPFLDNFRVATYSTIPVGGWVIRKEKLTNLVKGERKCLWTRERIQMGLLRTTRAAASHLTSAERESPFPVSSARLCRQPGKRLTHISCDEVWKPKVANRES